MILLGWGAIRGWPSCELYRTGERTWERMRQVRTARGSAAGSDSVSSDILIKFEERSKKICCAVGTGLDGRIREKETCNWYVRRRMRHT